jgi:type IV secretion system protein TrbL
MNILKYGVAAIAIGLAGAAYAQTGALGGAVGGAVGGVTGSAAGGATGGLTGATGGVTATPPRTPAAGATIGGEVAGSTGATAHGADTSAMAGVSLSSAKKSDIAMGAKVTGAGGATIGTVSNVATDSSGKITGVTVKSATGAETKTLAANDLRLHNGTLMSSMTESSFRTTPR